MQKVSLIALGRHELGHARTASSGRSASSVVAGHERLLRQTVIALRAGEQLGEHENPGEATVQVLSGRVVLRSGPQAWTGSAGDVLEVPDARHSLDAVDDAIVLLTVAKVPGIAQQHPWPA